ncbi:MULTISPECIES: hypothetical protein [Enterobacteriaceae]|uniref:hypothetical protein n=1 Tax=Enterobacteriaceae TaxID=543 RepID=UPI00061AA0AF|nr:MULTISPECIES: hypothetical protein [Enterobacteriaceae]EGP0948988.1 hypothetical protein [Salmonella enterica subsp. enterica serovar Java]KKC64189.1 hypothetical protein WG82_08395 [Citrobacter amalonaticus]MDU1182148.1 hypothetical protein [Citrobacter sp.]EHB8445969.1 hypothetical protein [Escherichia coli]EHB8455435.1 hypothetical protein [Escherichia coli]
MFKSFDTTWLKQALLRVCQSGWTILVLAGISMFLCSFHGRPAFMVWWLAFSGVVLLGFSIFLGNLPYRLIQAERHLNRYAYFWSWVIWAGGFICLLLSSLYATPAILLLLFPAGAFLGVLFCLWVSRKGLLAWIQ